MRASDIIRNLLDLMDEIDRSQRSMPGSEIKDTANLSVENPLTKPADANHFKQIFNLLAADKPQLYHNSPAEVVTGIEAVTTDAGGGWNGPKNPADLRAANSFSMYPNYQAENKGQ